MIKFINSVLNKKIKIFNFIFFIAISTLFFIFDVDVKINMFPANIIFFMSFSNVAMMLYKKQFDVFNNENLSDFRALLLMGILISLLSLFFHIIIMIFTNRMITTLYSLINLTLLFNVAYAAMLLTKISKLLITENLEK